MEKALALTTAHTRALERDEVEIRARFIAPNGSGMTLLIVNITAMGLMARGDMPGGVGDLVKISLPIVGAWDAEIRWMLGGRMGFAFPTPIDTADYPRVLEAMRR